MIDMHCHLIPGIDDGPPSLAEALELARMAVADGITDSVVTPHIHPGRYENDLAKIDVYFKAFKHALTQREIPLRLHMGSEVRVSADSLGMLLRRQIPFVGRDQDWPVILLEMPHNGVPVGALALVEKLLRMQIRPMIAHPERNKAFMENPGRLSGFIACGCWLQLTAGSITGSFGKTAQRVAWQLLDEDSVRVVATDAHNHSSRPPTLSRARDLMAKRWGDDLAEDLTLRYPARLLNLPVSSVLQSQGNA